MITTLTNVAVQDQTALSNIVYFQNVMEGVDGSTAFGYNIEKTSLKVENNQERQVFHDHTFDIRALDPSSADIDTLQVMINNNREVRISAYGPDGFLLINEGVQLNYNRQFDQVVTMPLQATVRSTSGYEGAAPNTRYKVYAGDNVMSAYDVSGGSGLYLNGFGSSIDAGITPTQSGGVQTLVRVSGTGEQRSEYILFPFVGIPITMSFEVTSVTGGDYGYALIFYDAIGSEISRSSATSGATGRISVTATTPAATRYIRMAIEPGTSAADAVSYKEPMFALNGRTVYIP